MFQRPETATESDTLEHVPILGSVQQSTVSVQKMKLPDWAVQPHRSAIFAVPPT